MLPVDCEVDNEACQPDSSYLDPAERAFMVGVRVREYEAPNVAWRKGEPCWSRERECYPGYFEHDAEEAPFPTVDCEHREIEEEEFKHAILRLYPLPLFFTPQMLNPVSSEP